MSITLLGYRASGKTTIGQKLAQALSLSWVDSDEEIIAQSGQQISQLFEHGETYFRDYEERVIANLLQGEELVLSTGGGCIVREKTRALLRQQKLSVYLCLSPDHIVERLRKDPGDRPSLTGAGLLDEVEAVLAERDPWYRESAELHINAAQSVAEIVAEIIQAYQAK